MPGASKTPPRLLNRWRTPIALAASVLCSLALLMHWQAGTDSTSPIMVAQAPQPETSVPTMRADDTPTAPLASAPQASQASGETGKDRGNGGASEATQAVRRQEMVQDKPGSDSRVAPLPHEAGKDTPPPTQIARALLPDDLPARTAAPAPASTAAAPQADEHTPAAAAAPANPEKAKAWIKLIEELIKADLRQDALTEWEKFRQAYPRYPAPEKLEAQIRALKK